MKIRLASAAVLAALLSAASLPSLAANVDVGVSIQISQPGIYGRVDIGQFPQPRVIVTQPVVVHRPAVVIARPQPVYLWVPRAHRLNWRRHCAAYGACGTPVLFVRHDWYQDHVAPRGRGHDQGYSGKGRDKGYQKGHDKGHGKGHDKGRRGHDD